MSSTSPTGRGPTNRISRTVQWGDCDPAGIVFYPAYYRWFDEATWALFKARGLTPSVLANDHGVFGTPLLETHARYFSVCPHGTALTIDTTLDRWTRSTFRVVHQIRKGATLAVEGHELRIWGIRTGTDAASIRAGPIPAEVKALFR